MKEIHLGIHYGHNATIAVVENGKLIFCQSEERLNRIKNSIGFPEQTLDFIYRNICKPEEVSTATLFQESVQGYQFLKSYGFKPFQYGNYLSPEDNLDGLFHKSELRWWLRQIKSVLLKENNKRLCEESMRYYSKALGLPCEKILKINHHMAHAWSTYGNIQDWGETLVFTLDGQGDGICATVSQVIDGKLTLLDKTDHRNSLGYYYSAITSLLGMKSGEHEFKVMGLAPYASKKYYLPILEKFKHLLKIDAHGAICSTIPPNALRYKLGAIIQYQRFDNVAGAIQEFTEDIILNWVHYWIKKTEIQNISVAGGVFMNVKACQKLYESDCINKMFVMPSAADESTAIGAAFWSAKTKNPKTRIQPIRDLYLGMSFSDEEIEEAVQILDANERYDIVQPGNVNKEIAKLLASNNVVARCCGRMEFGARALGNRSILANPKSFENIDLINSVIKSRDFWMPFTPSILKEDMARYVVKPDIIIAPYMCITFNTTEAARKDLKAAIHPRDKTVRPQSVVRDWNPDYYELISEFKKLTGIGGVLNTSFNLHGEPNVCSPTDAINTVDKSGLNYLVLGSFLFKKKFGKQVVKTAR